MFNMKLLDYLSVLSNIEKRIFVTSVDFGHRSKDKTCVLEGTIITKLKAAEMAKSQLRINHF